MIRTIVMKLLSIVGCGPRKMYKDDLAVQVGRLLLKAHDALTDGRHHVDASMFSDAAISAVIRFYSAFGRIHARRTLSPAASGAGWCSYPSLELRYLPYSTGSQMWNVFTRIVWWLVTPVCAMFSVACCVAVVAIIAGVIGGIVIAAGTVFGGYAVSYLASLAGWDAGRLPFIACGLIATTGVLLWVQRELSNG